MVFIFNKHSFTAALVRHIYIQSSVKVFWVFYLIYLLICKTQNGQQITVSPSFACDELF